MNFKDMTYLKKIAECQSYSRAAGELFLSQPALSRTVKLLEQEFGVKLFYRAGKKTAPTAEGLLVLESAERILNIREQMERHFAYVSQQSPPVILMLSTQIMPTYYAAAALTKEGIRLEQIISHQEWMDSMPWDLHMTILKSRPESRETVVLRQVGLCCVMDRDHPLAMRETLGFLDLEKVPLLLPVPNSAARNDMDEIFAKGNFRPHIVMETDNYPSYGDFLAGRNWVALAPDYSAGFQYSPALTLRPWAEFDEEHKRYLCLSRNKNKPLSHQAEAVWKQLIQFCGE